MIRRSLSHIPGSISPVRYCLVLILFLAAIPLISGSEGQDDWPYWRGPGRNGISSETGWNPIALESGVNILWESHVNEGYSSVTVKDGLLFTMGNSNDTDIVYCLKADTGEEIWRFSYSCTVKGYPGAFTTPVIEDGNVYTMSRNGDVYCLDAGTGKRKWSVNIVPKFRAEKPKYGFSGSPVIFGDKLILNSCKYGLALDRHTGKKIWSSGPGRAGYATPVLYTYRGRNCVVVFSHRRLNGVDVETGKRLWHFPWIFDDGADSADPVVIGNRVFISTAYRNGATVIDFTDNKPKQIWFKKDIQDEFGSSIYKDGYLYVPHGDTRHRTAYLKCIHFDTGEELWSRDTGHCSLIYVDSKFIVLNQWGELLIMEATEKGFQDLSKVKVMETSGSNRCWTAPVLANGRIYIRSSAGILLCVDVSFPETSKP